MSAPLTFRSTELAIRGFPQSCVRRRPRCQGDAVERRSGMHLSRSNDNVPGAAREAHAVKERTMISRRRFIETGVCRGGLRAFACKRRRPRADTVRVGFIRRRQPRRPVARRVRETADVEIAALCDVYDPISSGTPRPPLALQAWAACPACEPRWRHRSEGARLPPPAGALRHHAVCIATPITGTRPGPSSRCRRQGRLASRSRSQSARRGAKMVDAQRRTGTACPGGSEPPRIAGLPAAAAARPRGPDRKVTMARRTAYDNIIRTASAG